MSVETDLLHGIAQALDDASIGVWSTTTAYTVGQVGIYVDEPNPQAAEAITLTAYPVADPVANTSTVGVQVTVRSATADALRDRCDAIFAALHALWGVTLGGCRVQHLLRRSGTTPQPRDIGGPLIRTDNYYALIHHPSAHRAT